MKIKKKLSYDKSKEEEILQELIYYTVVGGTYTVGVDVEDMSWYIYTGRLYCVHGERKDIKFLNKWGNEWKNIHNSKYFKILRRYEQENDYMILKMKEKLRRKGIL